MRYIGNKTKLLAFIRATLQRRGIGPGAAVDPFTGTASVARDLKRLGHRVLASDIMTYGRVFAEAYVVADPPNGGPDPLPALLRRLNGLAPRHGFFRDNFSPTGSGPQRMYFTPENAGRIQAVRDEIDRLSRSGEIRGPVRYALLASLIEAADRVANTAGVYAAYIKSWQPNARKPLTLRAPRRVEGPAARARTGDAAGVVRESETFDLLYLDPPYNERQYPGYYHVPELIAEGWAGEPPELRGKTGLLPDEDKRSDWCRRGRAGGALAEILDAADCRHVVMSYNSEGILEADEIASLLRAWGEPSTFRRYFRRYKRYRADSDRAGRSYAGDTVREYLFCVAR